MQILLNLLAGVALLVWGTHIVRTDILRLYGGDLRRVLRQSVANRFAAFGAGLAVTALLQSSTATALIVASFVAQGLIATAPALSVMLGADVGTSLMVLLFSFDLSWLSPFLIFAGVVLFTAALAASKVIGVHVALALVLGANLGSGVMAMLNTLHSTPEARRVTLGNFLFKLLGCIAFAPFLEHVETLLAAIDPSE